MEIKKSILNSSFAIIFAILFAILSFFAFMPLNNKQELNQVEYNSDFLLDDSTSTYFSGSLLTIPNVSFIHLNQRDLFTQDFDYSINPINTCMYSTRFEFMNPTNSYDGESLLFSFSRFAFPLLTYDEEVDENQQYWVTNSAKSSNVGFNTTGIVLRLSGSTVRYSYNNVNDVAYQYIKIPLSDLEGGLKLCGFNSLSRSWVETPFSSSDILKVQVFDSQGRSADVYGFRFRFNLPTAVRPSCDFSYAKFEGGNRDWGSGSIVGAFENYGEYSLSYYSKDSDPFVFTISSLFFADSFLQPFFINYFYFSDSNDQQYSQGYNTGYDVGFSEGSQNGFDTGLNQGYSNGYTNGYSAGVNDAGTYTFTGLISAVIDAPIKSLLGLFDFQIFGVDFRTFALALLTFSIILVIVRILLKGGK